MNFKAIFIGLFLFPISLWSQLSLDWKVERETISSGRNDLNSIASDATGNIYVTGHYFEGGPLGYLFASKYDQQGNELWTVSHAGQDQTESNHGNVIRLSKNGRLYVGGMVTDRSGDIGLMKVTTNGKKLWVRQHSTHFLGGNRDEAIDMEIGPYGRLFMVSNVVSTGGNLEDMLLGMYDTATGNEYWKAQYSGGSGPDYPVGVEVDGSGHVYALTGSFDFWGTSTYDFILQKFSNAGQVSWQNTFGCNAICDDYPTDFDVQGESNIAMTGLLYNADKGNYDIGAFKVNDFGSKIWKYAYNGSANGHDTAVAIQFDREGNIVLVGNSQELNGSTVMSNIFVVKLDDQGNALWETRFAGEDDLGAQANAMQLDANGNVVVAGWNLNQNSIREPLLLTVSAGGASIQSTSLDAIVGNAAFLSTGITATGKIVAAGFANSSNGRSDQLLAQYSSTLITGLPTMEPEQLRLFPNPADQSIKIEGDFDHPTFFIRDLNGKPVMNGSLEGNKINVSHLQNGMYLLQLGGMTTKMVIAH